MPVEIHQKKKGSQGANNMVEDFLKAQVMNDKI
jgi:hypothetical protein